MAFRATPKNDMVERYLREFHGEKIPKKGEAKEEDGHNTGESGPSGGGGCGGVNSIKRTGSNVGIRRKNSAEVTKKPSFSATTNTIALQQQRESLEKLIIEKYWKHPVIVEALQLERCCERLETEMSQMLLPLANVAREIMDQRKGRLKAVAVVRREKDVEKEGRHNDEKDDDSNDDDREDEEDEEITIVEVLGWRDVPYMRELLRVSFVIVNAVSVLCRRLKSEIDWGDYIVPLHFLLLRRLHILLNNFCLTGLAHFTLRWPFL